MQEIAGRANSWDPFLYQDGLIGCGAHRLMEHRILNVNGSGTFGDAVFSTTNDLGLPAPYSPNQPWGALDQSYKWCTWQKIEKVN